MDLIDFAWGGLNALWVRPSSRLRGVRQKLNFSGSEGSVGQSHRGYANTILRRIYKTLCKTLPKKWCTPKPQNLRTPYAQKYSDLYCANRTKRTPLHTLFVMNTNVL